MKVISDVCDLLVNIQSEVLQASLLADLKDKYRLTWDTDLIVFFSAYLDFIHEIKNAKNDTKDFTGTTVLLAINYGGKDEIIRGIKKLAAQKKDFSSITEQDLSLALDTKNIPDVDLLIRTGGELRLSNFLLWQAAYAELIFTDTLWPDYTKEEFIKNIQTFQHRTRRFGGIK